MDNHDNESTAMAVARPMNGIARQTFGGSELEHRRETQSTALAERAKAEVQARFIMAERKPRDIDEVRVRLLKHCKRKGFAERAEYTKPVGGRKIVGPSIRFVEAALQEYGNVMPESTVTFEDDDKIVVRISVTDLERNITYYDDAVIDKFVEDRNPKQGDEIIGSRINSQGATTYKVRANEDRFSNKLAASVSKKLRNLGLRILPADLVDEAMELCAVTRKATTNQDPDAARKQIADAFAQVGVTPVNLAEYLAAPIEQASPADLDELRVVWVSIRDGEARWPDLLEAKRAERGEVEKPSSKSNEAASKVREKLAARKTKEQPKARPMTEDEKREIEQQEAKEAE